MAIILKYNFLLSTFIQNYATPEIKVDKLSQEFQQLSNKLENMSTACARL